jgi:hypothetical protein
MVERFLSSQSNATGLWQTSAPGWIPPPRDADSGGSPGARVSRRVGAGGVADRGQWARSFIASGAPPGPLASARFETSSPTRRDTHFHPPSLRDQHLSRAISVPLRAVNHGQQRTLLTVLIADQRLLTVLCAQPSKLAMRFDSRRPLRP